MPREFLEEEKRSFADELKPGTQLLRGQYTILKFLNSGGFGITYLAQNSLDRDVVIKECFPGSLCRREDLTVTPRSRAHMPEYQKVVRLFVQEAKSLAKLIHPHIVGVHQVFEDNETAYMAMDYVDGRDLIKIIETDRASITPPQVMGMLRKLLGAVGFIHEHGMLHRDISPDNVLVDRKGEPILIDFGAARQQASAIGGKALSAMRVVKEGYSPQEFYVSGSLQNQSSDLYGLGATFYHLISGEAPPDSQARLVAIAEGGRDPYVPLAGRVSGYPDNFLSAIDKALRVLPKDRLQSAQEWLDLIDTRPGLKVVALRDRKDIGAARSEPRSKQAGSPEPAATAETKKVSARPPVAEAAEAKAKEPARDARRAAGNGAAKPGKDEADPRSIAATLTPTSGRKGAKNRAALLAGATALVALSIAITVYPKLQSVEAGAVAVPSVAPQAAVTGPAAAPSAAIPQEGPSAVAEPEVAAAAAPPEAAPQTPESGSVQGASAQQISAAEAFNLVPVVAEVAVVKEVASTVPAEPARKPVVERVVGTEPEANAQVEPETSVDVSANQIAEATWRVALPFETAPTAIAGRSFPQITAVKPDASADEVNAWIADGAVIFAVAGSFVSGEGEIVEILSGLAGSGAEEFLYVPLRIKDEPSGPFREVTLAVTNARHVELVNGVNFEVRAASGGWRTTVSAVAEETEGGLRVGDVILADAQTGEGLDGPDAIEALIGQRARALQSAVIFDVERDGAPVRAAMALSTKGQVSK